MLRKLRTFELDMLTKAIVAVGIIILVMVALVLFLRETPELIPIVVIILLSVLRHVVEHYFGSKQN